MTAAESAPSDSPSFYTPSLRDRLVWKWRKVTHATQRATDAVARSLGYVRMERNSNYIHHARREFKAAGWDLQSDEMQRLMCEQVCELLGVYSTHGHSGSSAPYANSLFTKLAAFEPIVPLTGEDWEWNECGDGVFQNSRCGHVFKQPDRFDGQAYDIDAVIFREPNGCCYTNSESRQPITFPYTPTRKYVDVES